MPILEAVVGGYFLGKGALAVSAAVGGALVATGGYLFGWSNGSKETAETKAQLARLTEIKDEREQKRMKIMDELVDGLVVRKQDLDEVNTLNQSQINTLTQGIEVDKSAIEEQSTQFAKTQIELEKCVQQQQALLLALQKELHEKMEALDKAQKELLASKEHFEETAKELIESREQIELSEQALKQVQEELLSVSTAIKEKDSQIISMEEKVENMALQIETGETKLKQAALKIDELLSKNMAYKSLVKSLTEQLSSPEEKRQESKASSSSPRFF